MSNAVLENPTLESLAAEVRQLKERLEDMEDLMELRAAVERNAGKPGIPWGQVKAELGLEDRHPGKSSSPSLLNANSKAATQSGKRRSMSEKPKP